MKSLSEQDVRDLALTAVFNKVLRKKPATFFHKYWSILDRVHSNFLNPGDVIDGPDFEKEAVRRWNTICEVLRDAELKTVENLEEWRDLVDAWVEDFIIEEKLLKCESIGGTVRYYKTSEWKVNYEEFL